MFDHNMMSESEEIIQAYIQKVLKIQEENKEQFFDDETLHQKIAQELGLSQAELELVKKKYQDYVKRGQGYSRYEDWDSAIDEFSQAIILKPTSVTALYGLANAYKNRGQLRGDKDAFNKAKRYVKRALQIDPSHDDSFRLASELNKGANRYSRATTDKSSSFRTLNDELKTLSDEFGQIFSSADKDNIPVQLERRLKKSNRDKKIFGVCAGIGEYFGIDSTWIRIAFILGSIFGGGASVPLYVLLAFVMPKN